MKKIVLGIIIIAFIAGGGVYFLPQNNINEASEPSTNEEPIMGELKIEDVKPGTGREAKAGDMVTVHYVGTFSDGRKFDSSRDRGEPLTFELGAGKVIAGWDQGVAGMKVGGTRKLTIPPNLGYGYEDYGPIPGNSMLFFDVELLGVE